MRTELKTRCLPPLLSREEMMEIMQREVYGFLPNVPFSLSASEPVANELRYMCATVEHSFVNLTVTVGERSHAFRVDRLLHTDGRRRPLVVFLNFHPELKSPYFPTEEMSEYDADYLVAYYKDITSDDPDFTNGIAPLLLPEGQTQNDTAGKIALWAWSAMRILDYGLTLPSTDPDNLAVAGHSRLGKTALFTAMMDARFRFVLSNNAGCSGDALSRGNSGHSRPYRAPDRGELISDILRVFPYWFCKNYQSYAEKSYADTFDQHFLLGAIAPRFVLVGSCDEDYWADPLSEQLCALAASPAWEEQGLSGLVAPDRVALSGESFLDGHVGYYKLHSRHFLSRHGWRHFMTFIEKHKA